MDEQAYFEGMLAMLWTQARKQFGSAVKSYWFYDGAACPGCLRSVDTLKVKGQDALSFNAFMYRRRGILIGYLLCARCAQRIFRAMQRQGQPKESPLHAVIEQRLIEGYERYLRSLDA